MHGSHVVNVLSFLASLPCRGCSFLHSGATQGVCRACPRSVLGTEGVGGEVEIVGSSGGDTKVNLGKRNKEGMHTKTSCRRSCRKLVRERGEEETIQEDEGCKGTEGEKEARRW